MVFAAESFLTTFHSAALIDFAPSVLSLLGCEIPPTMKGTPIFTSQRKINVVPERQKGFGEQLLTNVATPNAR